MKTLYLFRHAKSDWGDPSVEDRDRPLNKRGRRAAAAMAGYLREHDIWPDLVLCSTARRAVETLEALAVDLERAVEVDLEEDLYLADAGALADRIRLIPAALNSVMLIGHNPGMHELAVDLASEGAHLASLEKKFPTAAVAAIVFEREDWDVQPGSGRLAAFIRPRELE